MDSHTLSPILVVEDNDEDFDILLWTLNKVSTSVPVYRCSSGEKALDFLYQRGDYQSAPRPGLILLDLKLAGIDGHDVLAAIKNNAHFKLIPVIIWSSSTNISDISHSFALQADSYIQKSANIQNSMKNAEALKSYWYSVISSKDIPTPQS